MTAIVAGALLGLIASGFLALAYAASSSNREG